MVARDKLAENQQLNEKFKQGQLFLVDRVKHGDPTLASAIASYANAVDINRQSRLWRRSLGWVENIFFGAGKQYVDDILISRLSRGGNTGDVSNIQNNVRNMPKPVNDLLGRYVETNLALLTENRPRPRVTAKSDRRDDMKSAELAELTMEYLWEALSMPEKHRELARLILYCGTAWMEIYYDELSVRHPVGGSTAEESSFIIPSEEGEAVGISIPRTVTSRRSRKSNLEYGDIVANVVSPFELHLPMVHYWNGEDMGWVLREYYTPISTLQDRYGASGTKGIITKANGWNVDALDDLAKGEGGKGSVSPQNLPLWWFERLTDLVEGPGPSLYVGTPETWSGYTVVRVFDRKPSPTWPNGRTIIVAGEQLLYDSPKDRGARVFDPRWPKRWHPYVRYHWESMIGNIYARALVSKLLPKLKRINNIDTAMIMYRRTIPIASWIIPKGTAVVEDFFTGGQGGQIIEYDPRRTNNQAPQPIYPPAFPEGILNERATQVAEMEAIAGTEQILRGERPVGVNSATMLDVLRKQALASRSAILQAWDESLQDTGGALLQETVKYVKKDKRYAERIRLLARERGISRMSIEDFSGSDLQDNVMVRVDTISMALVSKEARQQRALEFIQYAQGMQGLSTGLQQNIIEELGFKTDLNPAGPDVDRAKAMIIWIKNKQFDRVVPFPEDNPYVFHELLVAELKDESYFDWDPESQGMLIQTIELYQQQIELIEKQQLAMQKQMLEEGGGGQ
jgi:hypothetical protein